MTNAKLPMITKAILPAILKATIDITLPIFLPMDFDIIIPTIERIPIEIRIKALIIVIISDENPKNMQIRGIAQKEPTNSKIQQAIKSKYFTILFLINAVTVAPPKMPAITKIRPKRRMEPMITRKTREIRINIT